MLKDFAFDALMCTIAFAIVLGVLAGLTAVLMR